MTFSSLLPEASLNSDVSFNITRHAPLRNFIKVIGILLIIMKEYLKKRPLKKVFPIEKIERLRNQAIDKIKSKLLPDEKSSKSY